MGRHMFGGYAGEWDLSWRGWWGEDPPYHAPVYVLTHHERAPLPMEGGTTFHFVTDGAESALAQARDAAGNNLTAGGLTVVFTRTGGTSTGTIGATTDNNTGAGPTHWYENYNPKNSRPWMIADAPDYQVPPTTQEARDRAAKARAARRGGDGYYRGPFDGPQDFTLYVRCITRGVPGSMMPAIYGNSYDITQGPGFVAIRYEMVHETRMIPLDGRPHVADSIHTYMGDARGHFEGDTLVVETTNYLEA